MQALMLAAGMGKRLGKLTGENTKCMLEVAGEKLIDRAIEAVELAGITKMVIVVGYKGDNLVNYINENYKDSKISFEFINNKDYATSNNIYSFYMAKEYLEKDDTILMESDLIYEKELVSKLVNDCHENIAAVAKYKSWMDGTCVTLDDSGNILQFIEKANLDFDSGIDYYKTVNIYKFTKDFCKNIYIPFLESYMKAYGLNSYYETVLKVISHLSNSNIYGYEIGNMAWYEIDDIQDYDIASVLFSKGKEKYDLVASKFGGYWRYDKMLDFCYLVNPYFPTKTMIEKMQREFPVLLGNYPSGLAMQNMNAERIFGVNRQYLLVGNGASELINALGVLQTGVLAVGVPTFNEYVRCFRNCEIKYVDNSQINYGISLEAYKKACEDADLLCVVSPDNPSGAMLSKDDALELIEYAKSCNTNVLIDESFIDFADKEVRYTLLNNEILEKYPNLIVMKSIGKSYGVAGLRLGVLASSNIELLADIKKYMQIWNINSFAEYYLQIYNLFAKDYVTACDKIAYQRNRMINEINKMQNFKAYTSQANYILVEVKSGSSYDLCVKALEENNIFIKDLSTKNYFKGKNFIRIAVKDEEENNILLGFLSRRIEKV